MRTNTHASLTVPDEAVDPASSPGILVSRSRSDLRLTDIARWFYASVRQPHTNIDPLPVGRGLHFGHSRAPPDSHLSNAGPKLKHIGAPPLNKLRGLRAERVL